jgi:hypothetical protein
MVVIWHKSKAIAPYLHPEVENSRKFDCINPGSKLVGKLGHGYFFSNFEVSESDKIPAIR